MERIRTMVLPRLPAGVVAAVAAGVAVGLLATVPGGGAEAPPWGAWMVHAVIFGAVLGLLGGGRKQSLGSSLAAGLLLGLADWLFRQLTLSVLVSGAVPKWTLAEAVSTFDELVRTVLLGAVAGPVMYGLVALWHRRAVTGATVPRKPHIVVVGGGFGGVGAARRLDALVARGLQIEITVISESNFLLFTPLLVGVAASTLEPRHVSAPVRAALRYASFLHGRVESVDPDRRELVVAAGSRGRQRVPYDELILAVGRCHDCSICREWRSTR